MPTTLNYRYRFGRASQAMRMYAGPSVGALKSEWTYRVDDSKGIYSSPARTSSSWQFACGATLGLSYRLKDAFEVDLGYRFTFVNYTGSSLKMHGLSFGAGMTF